MNPSLAPNTMTALRRRRQSRRDRRRKKKNKRNRAIADEVVQTATPLLVPALTDNGAGAGSAQTGLAPLSLAGDGQGGEGGGGGEGTPRPDSAGPSSSPVKATLMVG